MTSLRELIEAKQRRRASLPVLVGDAAGAARRVSEALTALHAHQAEVGEREPTEDEQAEEQRLRDALTAALAAQSETVVMVELQSLPPAEWDAVFGEVEPDEDGEIDLDDYRAALLAASCVDEDLRDPDWWEQQLARPEWTKGDKINVNNTLIDLNLRVPTGPAGKG